jgi:integrase
MLQQMEECPMANLIYHGKNKQGKDRWLVRMYVKRDDNGKQIFHNHQVTGSRKQAERYAKAMETERDKQTFVEPSKMSLKEYLEQWLDDYMKPHLSPRTWREYRNCLERHVYPTLGSTGLDKLLGSQMRFQKLINDIAETERGDGGKTIRTAQYVYTVLKQALKHAHALGLIGVNPMQHTKRPKGSPKEMRPLTRDESMRFLESAAMDRLYPLFALMLETGMRPGEALGLRWDDVDFEVRSIYVQRSLERADSTGWRLKEPKTKRSRRHIPMTPTMVRVLHSHRSEQLEQRVRKANEYCDHGFVFATATGEPLRKNNIVRRNFKQILQAAELPLSIRLYDLRHTCATLLLQAGENPKIVSERLGHASVVITLDVYSHVLPHMQESATMKLESILFGQRH